jgi:hypothetical protein
MLNKKQIVELVEGIKIRNKEYKLIGLNKMKIRVTILDGKKKSYTEHEIHRLLKIDIFFKRYIEGNDFEK